MIRKLAEILTLAGVMFFLTLIGFAILIAFFGPV